MINSNITLGKIWGIPIGLHISWFIIFGLLTFSLATGYMPVAYPQLSPPTHWGLGAVTSLLFAGSVLAHELGHAFVALRNRLQVRSINLFIFGGVAQVESEPRSPGAEFRIAIAGPLVSLALAVAFGGLWLLDRPFPLLAAPSEYLMRINLILALFNMIPGFPLDGGRVLRSIVWWRTRNYAKATRVASGAGQLVAFGFIGIGLLTIFAGSFFDGMWLAFIGWFLYNSAASAQTYTRLQEVLQNVKVSQVMSTDCMPVSSLTPLSTLVEEQVLSGHNRSCFFVADLDRPHGILTLQDIAGIPRAKWRYITSYQAMRPLERLLHLRPETDLLSALQQMESSNLAYAPVMHNNQFVGLLSKDQALGYLRTRVQLGI